MYIYTHIDQKYIASMVKLEISNTTCGIRPCNGCIKCTSCYRNFDLVLTMRIFKIMFKIWLKKYYSRQIEYGSVLFLISKSLLICMFDFSHLWKPASCSWGFLSTRKHFTGFSDAFPTYSFTHWQKPFSSPHPCSGIAVRLLKHQS